MSAADIMAVTVNAVAPGPTATLLFLDCKRRETTSEPASLPPLQRLGTPTDIAEVAFFLAGPARWVNGQVLYANGGGVTRSLDPPADAGHDGRCGGSQP
jgi:3-oxoacyl-[acyl-carrier protein] reductase